MRCGWRPRIFWQKVRPHLRPFDDAAPPKLPLSHSLSRRYQMTEEQIKEQLSRHFVELVANREGFKCSKPDPDHGDDLLIHRATPEIINGKRLFIPSGETLQVQLKCTCERQIVRADDGIKYDLDADAYNRLVFRRQQEGSPVPYVLVLLVLPDDEGEWLQVGADQLILRRDAYWYYPERGLDFTQNTSSKRISVPTTNAVKIDFCSNLFRATLS